MSSSGSSDSLSLPEQAAPANYQGGQRLLLLQTRVLEQMARGANLRETLDTLAQLVEREFPGSRCGICVMDASRRVIIRSFGPSLPEAYREALARLALPIDAPYPGPCAQCMVENTFITCADLREVPAWAEQKWAQVLIEQGFTYSRCTPIQDTMGNPIGSLSLYLPGSLPEPASFPALSEISANLAAIALEREAAGQALQESNLHLRTALEGAELGEWNYNLLSGEIYWSERSLELFGLPQGSSYRDFLEHLHPDDREHVDRSVESALADSGNYSEEYRVRQPDGSYRWLASMGRGVPNDEGVIQSMHGITFDIGERKDAEERQRATETLARTQTEHLERAERNLRVALDATGLGLWSLELADDLVTVSERCREMHGFDQTTATAAEWMELIHPEDREAFQVKLTNSLDPAGDGNLRAEYRLITAQGTHWISVFGKAVFEKGPQGLQGIRLTGATLDLTDRKLMEHAVEENANRFRFLAESLPAKIFTTDAKGEISYLNEQWATYTGRPLDVVATLGWREFVHPQDIEEKHRVWMTAINEGTPFEFEHRFRRADGQYRWHLSRAQPMRDATGRILTWIGTNMDVHDLKQAQLDLEASESRVRLAVEAAGIGYWDWDIGNTVHWSAEHNRIMGMDQGIEDGTYQSFLERVHPEDRSSLVERLEHSERTGEDFDAEFRVIWPNGSLHWVAGHGRPFFEARKPRAVRMLGVVRDVTERKDFEDLLSRQQQELRAALAAAELARDEAQRANSAKDHFLAVLSHELRTPLTPVLMAVSTMLFDPALDAETRETMEMVRRNIQLEARLINDLLDLTRITRNQMELQTSPIHLHEVIRHALEICRRDLDGKPLHLELELVAEHDLVEGDSARLQQVFWNLFNNAVKFTPAQGQLHLRTFNEDGNILAVMTDTGIGIHPDALSKIFNPFEQGSESFSREFGGLGLGLAISKSTIDAHEGLLTAASPGLNQGSTFTVRLKNLPPI